jgi:nucleotide-binding universal stress UspA family protein
MVQTTPTTQQRSLGIVLGYDGSESADHALEWAVDESRRSGLPLTIATAYSVPSYPSMGMEGMAYSPADDSIRQGAESVASDGAKRARRLGVEAEVVTALGDASGVLRDLSERAELLVLGARGRGGFLGLLVGSTASAVPAHALCPSVIVPKRSSKTPEPDERESVIVVGVDGSDRGRVAALKAAERAVALNVPLRLVCALPPLNGSVAWLPPAEAIDTVRADLQTQLEAGAAWLRSLFEGLTVETSLLDGTPAQILTEYSERVRLTVVGARGGGGFMGLLLGSTSQAVLSQARGPVMVVPENNEDPRLASRADYGPDSLKTL